MANATGTEIPVWGSALAGVTDEFGNFTFFSAACLAAVALVSYIFVRYSTLKDTQGNKIPHGPTGFPVLGE